MSVLISYQVIGFKSEIYCFGLSESAPYETITKCLAEAMISLQSGFCHQTPTPKPEVIAGVSIFALQSHGCSEI